MRIVLADDEGLSRDGLSALVDQQLDMDVVGVVSDPESVAGIAIVSGADIVILGGSVLDSGGDGLVRRVLDAKVGVAVVVLCDRGSEARFPSATDTLARDSADRDAFLAVLRAVVAPRGVRAATDRQRDAAALAALLSPREVEVLRLIAAGHTNREAAEQMGVSVKTVEGYRARLIRKLGVRGRADLVRISLECGLLSAAATS